MPELPEAENIRRALDRVLNGEIIRNVEIFSPSMREPLTPLLDSGLAGHAIIGVRRRGRYVLADLDDRRTLMMHFGMSGVVRVERADVPRRKHEHVFIHFQSGRIFRFECTRRFSLLKVCNLSGRGAYPDELAALGVEPLSNEFDFKYLHAQSKRHCIPVKNLLMDNAVVVGIGNIYAAETLFAAGISPLHRSNRLTLAQCRALTAEAKRILQCAIDAGGTSISDFLNVDGSEGKFSQELMVYGKAGQPCPRCGATIQCVRLGGRSSCFCPNCQH